MIWQTLAALLPLVVLTGGMLVFNLPARRAALLALLLVSALSLTPGVVSSPGGAWLAALPDAVVLTLTVGLTLFFGLLLHQLMDASGAMAVLLEGVGNLGRNPLQRLAWVLLVFGPLFESISGFGLAIMIVVPMLLAMGYSPLQTLSLSLLSQLAVPWGALAIGVVLGAAMSNLSLPVLGAATAVLALPVYMAFWGTALWLARPSGSEQPSGILGSWLGLGSLLWSAAALTVFATGIWIANRWISPELGGLAGPGLLAGWLWLLGARQAPLPAPVPVTAPAPVKGKGKSKVVPGKSGGLSRLLVAAAPHLVLVAVLVVTRFMDPLRDWLNDVLVLRLPGGNFALPVLYNPGAALAIACVVAAGSWRAGSRKTGSGRKGSGKKSSRAARRDSGSRAGGRTTSEVLRTTLVQWWRVVSALFVLILLARFMLEGGLFAALAHQITGLVSGTEGAAAHPAGRLFIPLIAAMGGFLTGSVAGSNALFLDLQTLLASGMGLPVLWVTAVQNLLSAGFTALSPARVVFAATMTGLHGQEAVAMRHLLPLAAVLVGIGALALLPGVLALLSGARWLTGG